MPEWRAIVANEAIVLNPKELHFDNLDENDGIDDEIDSIATNEEITTNSSITTNTDVIETEKIELQQLGL